MTAVQHSSYMMIRYMRALARQPAWIFVTLVQPVIWLLLFGALFERTVEIPGFASDSYIEFLAPGVVVMTAFFSAGWSGMGMIQDYDRGILDRFLSSPVKRVALVAGPLMQNAVISIRKAEDRDDAAIWRILEPTIREGATYTLPYETACRARSLRVPSTSCW